MRSAIILAAFDFFALGGLGVFFPFYSMYLRETAGLSGSQVGTVFAVMPLVGMLTQPLWGHLADRSGLRVRVLALLCLGSSAALLVLSALQGFAALAGGTALLALFLTSVMPMSVAITLALVADRGPHAYGLIRVWGTVGFLCSVVAFPRVTAWVTASAESTAALAAESGTAALAYMLPVTAALFTMAGLVSLGLPQDGAVSLRAGSSDWRKLAGEPGFLRLLLFMFFAYFFLQGPIALFPLFVRYLGGGVDVVSRMWVFMLLLEIPLVAMIGTSFKRAGARGLLAIGVASGAVRWLVSALTSNLALIYCVQMLHGLTVMGLILGAPLYVEAVVPKRLRSTGQGILAMVGLSLGGALSNLGSGWLIDGFDARAPALVGGCGALLLTLMLPLLVPAVMDRHDARPTPGQAPETAI
ncbi:MAG: MFS transporter [Candidatus Binatia bacterium]